MFKHPPLCLTALFLHTKHFNLKRKKIFKISSWRKSEGFCRNWNTASASQWSGRQVTQEKALHAAVTQSTAADKLYFYSCSLPTISSWCPRLEKPCKSFSLVLEHRPSSAGKLYWSAPANTVVCNSNGTCASVKRHLKSFKFPTETKVLFIKFK